MSKSYHGIRASVVRYLGIYHPLHTLFLLFKYIYKYIYIAKDNHLSIMASSTQTRKYSVDKLTIKNYRIWKPRMELLLDLEELLDVTTGTCQAPKNTQSEAWKDWKNKDKRAKLEILLHVEDKQADAIRKLATVAEMWSKLKQMFEPQDGTTRIHTLATLFHMCVLQEEEDVLTFLDTWETYLEEATTVGNENSEEMKIGLLLSKLPESWSTFVTMNSQGNSLSDLIIKIRHEKLRRQLKESTPSLAMTASFSKTQKSPYNNRYRAKSDTYRSAEISSTSKVNDAWKASTKQSNGGLKLICKYCKKEGHTEKVCRFKQAVENKRQSQANNATLEEKSNSKSEEYTEFGGDSDEILEDDNILQAYHVTAEETKTEHDTWYLDTGATHHLTYRKDWLNFYQILSNPLSVTFGDNGRKTAIGKGSIQLRLSDNHEITVPNVYYVPGLAKHLLSVGQATVDGLIIQFCKEKAILFFKNGNTSTQLVCPKEKHLYPIRSHPPNAFSAVLQNHKKRSSLTQLWHCRLGHVHYQALQQCQQQKRVHGLPSKIFNSDFMCESCLFGKMTHQPFTDSCTTTERLLQLVHTDLCGPFPIPSLSGARYFISFIDHTSRFTVVSFIKKKIKHLQHSASIKNMQKNKHQAPSRYFAATMEGNISLMNGKSFVKKMVYFTRKRSRTHHNRMVWQKGKIEPCLMQPAAC